MRHVIPAKAGTSGWVGAGSTASSQRKLGSRFLPALGKEILTFVRMTNTALLHETPAFAGMTGKFLSNAPHFAGASA
jgi:hypothetical protein